MSNMHTHTPSKKFLVGSLVVLILGTGGLYFLGKVIENNNEDNQTIEILSQEELEVLEIQASVAAVETITEEDADGDGLRDWEESLWGTDPSLADTDGDGISDFDFVTAEKARLQAAAEASGIDTSDENLTDSELLARDLYTSIAFLSQQEGGIDQETGDEITKELTASILRQSLYTRVTEDEITIVPATTQNIQAYVNAMQRFFEKNSLRSEDIRTLTADIENNSLSKTSFDNNQYYSAMSAELESIPVPIPGAELHMDLIDGHRDFANTFNNMSLFEEDSIRAMASAMRLEESLNHHQETVLVFIANLFEI